MTLYVEKVDLEAQELNNMKMEELFDFDDILLEPKKQTKIKSRGEIDHTYNGQLPLFVSPMDTVVSQHKARHYVDNNYEVCMPRNEFEPYTFNSFSLDEINESINILNPTGRYLIDIANGHMKYLADTVRLIKTKYPRLTLMVGNVANPATYGLLSDAGADYIRIGIGNGAGCLTTKQLGVGYPMGSLIYDCYTISMSLDEPAKIVADGGMKGYSDIIKALALGADYVMLGSILNKTIESAGQSYIKMLGTHIPVNDSLSKKLFSKGINVYKKFRGMSTKEVQKQWGKKKLKTSEGVVRYQRVEYTLEGWTTNMVDYLRSAMSYCGARDLSEFIGYVKFNRITVNAYRRFNK